jgi:DNA processing protein
LQFDSLSKARGDIDPEAELEALKGSNALAFDHPDYPELLKTIYDPPPLIYFKGRKEILNKRLIAIVGTRKPTSYGLSAAGEFAKQLSLLGFVIVSGFASGIDTAAHKGAFEAGGETVAVFGCGLDVIYPPDNIRLAEDIINSGCLISEFPPKTPTSNWTFPQRNRIISGLSRGVIVVEGSVDSGSLITAKSALDQGREVFAVPGAIESQNSKGPHWLIKQGAKLVESVEDILEELNIPIPADYSGGEKAKKDLSALLEGERAVYALLANEPLHIDVVSQRTGLPPQEVSSILMMLEVKGYIKQLPGKVFAVK